MGLGMGWDDGGWGRGAVAGRAKKRPVRMAKMAVLEIHRLSVTI